MSAVADRTLPIQPGDMLIFPVSGNTMFIIASSEQEHVSGSSGQHICGLLARSFTRTTTWNDIWIDWKGYDDWWKIVRQQL